MSIRDIIEAAPQMRWEADCEDCCYSNEWGTGCRDDDTEAECDERMLAQQRADAAMSRDHLLLMEEVVLAARAHAPRGINETVARLAAYRREKGLEPAKEVAE